MSTTPLVIPNLTNIGLLAAGSTHALAVTQSGSQVWAWGGGLKGQLGNGTAANRLVPTAVSNLTNVSAVAAGGTHSLALETSGFVWAWGDGAKGQLGNAGTANSNLPVRVGPSGVYLNDGLAIAAGASHSLAIKADHTVAAWGDNAQGQLGDNTQVNRTTPTVITGLNDVYGIAGGLSHSLALKSDGTVWAWGANNAGQLGDNTTTARKTPVQVLGLSGIVAIAAGTNHNLARKADGSLVSWGSNSVGQLGVGLSVARLTPATVPGLNILHAAPSVTITSPASGTVVAAGEPIQFRVAASDPESTLSKVVYANEGLALGQSAYAPFSLSLAFDTWGEFQLTATAYNEDNTPSLASPPVVLRIPPPITLTATGETDTSIRLTWKAVPHASTTYKVQRGLLGTELEDVTTLTAAGSNNYLDTGRLPNTLYFYRLTGYRDSAIAAMSREVGAATLGSLTPPAHLRAQAVSAGIELNWDPIAASSGAQIIIERRESRSLAGPYRPWHELIHLPGNSTSYFDAGLTFGQFAVYRLRTKVNASTSRFGNEVWVAMWLPPSTSSGGSGSGGAPNPEDPNTNPNPPPLPEDGDEDGDGYPDGDESDEPDYEVPGDGDGDGNPDNDRDGKDDVDDAHPDDPQRSRDLEVVNYASIKVSEGITDNVLGVALGEGSKVAFYWNAPDSQWGVAIWENGEVKQENNVRYKKVYDVLDANNEVYESWSLSAVGISANGDLAGTATRIYPSSENADANKKAIFKYSIAGIDADGNHTPELSRHSPSRACLGITRGGEVWGREPRTLTGSVYFPEPPHYSFVNWICPYTVTFVGDYDFPAPPTVNVTPPANNASTTTATVKWTGVGNFTPTIVSYGGTAASGSYEAADPQKNTTSSLPSSATKPVILTPPGFKQASRSIMSGGSCQPIFAPAPDTVSEVKTINDAAQAVGNSTRLTNQDPDAPAGATHFFFGQSDIYLSVPYDVKKQVKYKEVLAQSPGDLIVTKIDSLEGSGSGQWVERTLLQRGSGDLKIGQFPTPLAQNMQFNSEGNAAEKKDAGATFHHNLMIVPDDRVAGKVGDVVPSRKLVDGEKHFVSPQDNEHTSYIPDKFVVFKMIGISKEIFEAEYQWEGGIGVLDQPLKRQVRRDVDPGKYTIKIKKIGETQSVAVMNVWIVWATGGPVAPAPAPTLDLNIPLYIDNSFVKFKFAISPKAMFEENDVPALNGSLNSSATVPNGTDVITGLEWKKGVKEKWDMSRQVRIVVNNPSEISRGLFADYDPGSIFYARKKPGPFSGEIEPWPTKAGDPIVAEIAGNDDPYPAPHDEDNFPYTNPSEPARLAHAVGEVTSTDRPKITGPRPTQIPENTEIGIKYEFREFVRVFIGEKWYRVSEFYPWYREMKLKLENHAWKNNGSDYAPK